MQRGRPGGCPPHADLQGVKSEDLKRLRDVEGGQLIITGDVGGDAFGIELYIDALRRLGLEADVLSQVYTGSALVLMVRG